MKVIRVSTYMNTAILLEDFCHYTKYISDLSPMTVKRNHEKVSYFLKVSNITNLEEINSKIIKDFFLFGRTKKNWRPATYHTYYMSLRSFFKWCRKNDYISEDHLEGIELPKIKRALPKGIKKEEALKLLEVIYNFSLYARLCSVPKSCSVFYVHLCRIEEK